MLFTWLSISFFSLSQMMNNASVVFATCYGFFCPRPCSSTYRSPTRQPTDTKTTMIATRPSSQHCRREVRAFAHREIRASHSFTRVTATCVPLPRDWVVSMGSHRKAWSHGHGSGDATSKRTYVLAGTATIDDNFPSALKSSFVFQRVFRLADRDRSL